MSHEEDKLKVIVSTATKKESLTFHWSPESLVGTDADEAAKEFGLTPEQPPTLQVESGGEPFKRNSTLKQNKVKDGEKLELIAGGGGV